MTRYCPPGANTMSPISSLSTFKLNSFAPKLYGHVRFYSVLDPLSI